MKLFSKLEPRNRKPENMKRAGIAYDAVKIIVTARDGGYCQKCGDHHIELHHILSFDRYPGLRYIVENCILLCSNCHEEYHKLYGIDAGFKELSEYLGFELEIPQELETLVIA